MADANLHLCEPLSMFGARLRDARLAAILVHGRSQQPADMFDMIVRRLPGRDVAWLAPSAADASWYPGRFMEPVAHNEPQLGHALAVLTGLSEQLAAEGFPPEKQLLVGFSQGACLVCEFLWRSKRPHGALLAFTGGLIGENLPAPLPGSPFQGMPMLLSGCEDDPWVPAGRIRASAQLFRQAGGEVTEWIGPGAEHAIRDQEIELAQRCIAACA